MLVYMLLFQSRHIDVLLLRMAATMDPSSPVACCEQMLGVNSCISTQLMMERSVNKHMRN